MANIHFFNDGIDFTLKQKQRIRNWLTRVAKNNNSRVKNINYIFTSDEVLLELNNKYLGHDTLTDIITFNQSTDANVLEADIFISIDRVNENAISLQIPFNEELQRVIVHGLLHLLGFNDKTISEKKLMRNSENHYLVLLTQL